MRLSEAIRLGAMLKPQGFGDVSGADASCAIRAAFDAIGGDKNFVYSTVAFRFDMRAWMPRVCPVCAKNDDSAGTGTWIVYHLNDRHRWTREAIADWVETIEQQHESPAAGEPQAPEVAACLVTEVTGFTTSADQRNCR